MSSLDHFCDLCVKFQAAGYDVDDARYDGQHFGSWYLQIKRDGVRARQLGWDGRDHLLIVQVRNGGQWIDEWSTFVESEQLFENIVSRLT